MWNSKHVWLQSCLPKATVCDMETHLTELASLDTKYKKIIIHVNSCDGRSYQPDILNLHAVMPTSLLAFTVVPWKQRALHKQLECIWGKAWSDLFWWCSSHVLWSCSPDSKFDQRYWRGAKKSTIWTFIQEKNDIIIRGLDPNHHTNDSAVSTNTEDAPVRRETLKQQIVNFFQSRDIDIRNDIKACHRLLKKKGQKYLL